MSKFTYSAMVPDLLERIRAVLTSRDQRHAV
jgi:hypothetical protein